MAIAWSLLISTITSLVINSWPNEKLLGYDFYSQMKDIMPNLALSLIMGVLVYLGGALIPNAVLKLILQILFGAAIYVVLSVITRNESFQYMLTMIQNKIRK